MRDGRSGQFHSRLRYQPCAGSREYAKPLEGVPPSSLGGGVERHTTSVPLPEVTIEQQREQR